MITEDRDNTPKDLPHLIVADVAIMFPFTILFISITMAGKDRIPTGLYNALCVLFVIAVIGVVIYTIISYRKIREYQKKLREYEQKVQEHNALRKHKPIKRVKSEPAPAKKAEPVPESTAKVVEEPTVIEAPAKAKTTESSAFDTSSIPNGKRYPLKEGVLWDTHHQSYLVRMDDTWTVVLFYVAEGKRDPRFNIDPRWRREVILQKDYFDRFTANDLALILKSVNYGTTPGVLLSSLPMLKDGPVTIPVPEEAIVLLGDGNKAMWRKYGVISVKKYTNEQIERIDIMETRLDQMIESIDNTDPNLPIRRIKNERERRDAIFFENTLRILERYYDSEEWHKDVRISKTIRPYMTKKVLSKEAIPDVVNKFETILQLERINIMETRLNEANEFMDNTDPYLQIKNERYRWYTISFEHKLRELERYYESEEWHKDVRISKTIRPYMTKKVLTKEAIPDAVKKFETVLRDLSDSARPMVPDTQRVFILDIRTGSSSEEVDIAHLYWPEGTEEAIRLIIISEYCEDRSNVVHTNVRNYCLEKDYFEHFTSEDLIFIINEDRITTAELVSTIPMLKIGKKTIPFESRSELLNSKENRQKAGWIS